MRLAIVKNSFALLIHSGNELVIISKESSNCKKDNFNVEDMKSLSSDNSFFWNVEDESDFQLHERPKFIISCEVSPEDQKRTYVSVKSESSSVISKELRSNLDRRNNLNYDDYTKQNNFDNKTLSTFVAFPNSLGALTIFWSNNKFSSLAYIFLSRIANSSSLSLLSLSISSLSI